MIEHNPLLSTVDNPYDPFIQFEEWFLYDIQMGHNCCSLVAQKARISDRMSEMEKEAEVERAIDEIVLNDETNTFVKLTTSLS